ncbi:hypothetical protein OXYTRIMIC_506 [Oxytricha trifallax]|uniref:Uncharacterized protein n=1 Tax=Oxytricha trifallax TaxID=1172189 RepID=A0A073I015_9SPIT|nr:hypothetical protein OXYTRIMIC_506 [Oxytricha trifallax]
MPETENNSYGGLKLPNQRIGKKIEQRGPQRIYTKRSGDSQRGNQLDQIFSNVETFSRRTSQLNQPDHKLIQAKLKIKYQESDFKLSDKEKTIRISYLRKQCWKRQRKGDDRRTPELTDIQCFEDKIGKQFRGRNWYQQAPEQAIKSNGTVAGNIIQDTKTKWKEAMRDIEQC